MHRSKLCICVVEVLGCLEKPALPNGGGSEGGFDLLGLFLGRASVQIGLVRDARAGRGKNARRDQNGIQGLLGLRAASSRGHGVGAPPADNHAAKDASSVAMVVRLALE